MPHTLVFPDGLTMPLGDGRMAVYPFGRWHRGYVVDAPTPWRNDVQRVVRSTLRRLAWVLFVVLLGLVTLASSHRLGGPYITVKMRSAASTAIVMLPVFVFYAGRRLYVYGTVHRGAPAPGLGRLYVWANIDNAFGAAFVSPQGPVVAAPWFDAGRKYTISTLSDARAGALVSFCIALELCFVASVCGVLMRVYGQDLSCVWGVGLYYSVSQPVLSSVLLHALLPRCTRPWNGPTFNAHAIIARRYRWLWVFVISSVYLVTLLLTQGTQSLHVHVHARMQTHLYLAAFATATSYITLTFVCLIKTLSRPWSTHSRLRAGIARAIFLLAALLLMASIIEADMAYLFPKAPTLLHAPVTSSA